MKTENTGMEFLNTFLRAIRDTCKDCKWCDIYCICTMCEDEQFAMCSLKSKHVDKYNICENFENDDKE